MAPLNPDFEKGRGGPPDRRGAVVTSIGRDMLQRLTSRAGALWRTVTGTGGRPLTEVGGLPPPPLPPDTPGATIHRPPSDIATPWRDHDTRREPWMGPGRPMTPMAPKGDVAGRAFDFQPYRNMQARVRGEERVKAPQLRALADNADVVRLAIETRKDQMGKLKWSVLPKKKHRDELRAAPTPECQIAEERLRDPDRRGTGWDTWLRLLMEDVFVLDAPTIYARRTLAGDLYSLEVVDGATIVPVIDHTGRKPFPPTPAYQQILHGMVAAHYTSDELIYMPRNPRPGRIYGYSPVEQIITTVSIILSREAAKLDYYGEGNVPDSLIGVPKEWSASQIREYQELWDAMMADRAVRRKARFVPGDMRVQFTRDPQSLMDPFDEWLARVVCYAFSLPPLPFVKQMNRATSETAYDTAIEEGLQPMMLWVENLMNHIIQNVMGFRDIEFVWDEVEKIATQDRLRMDLEMMNRGLLSPDQVLARRGLPPIGLGNIIFGLGPHGILFVEDLKRARDQGLLGIQPPPMDPYGMPGGGGFIDGSLAPADPLALGHAPGPAGAAGGPGNGMAPGVPDLLHGVDPRLLAAVGLGPEGAAGRSVDITDREENESDPASAGAAHPEIMRTLRAFERGRGRK